jgi:diguanylate cyclase (GGDEF)-like protein
MRLSARLSGATWFRVALAAPLVVLAVALVASFTSRSYDYLVERPLAIALYIVFAVVHALVVIVRAKTSSRRSEGALIVGLGIVLLLVAVLNSLATYVPFMVLGMLWSLVMVYVRLQRARIFNDALTGLNNRRRADDFVSQQIARSRRQEKTLMYLMDIDGFKRINDTYGHLEGDRALKAVAGALRRAAGNYDGFAARWGGDEFVLVVPESPALAENPDEVTAFVNSALALLARDEGLPFEVSLTAGYAAIEPSDRRPRDPLRRADAMLYRRKRELYGPATPRLG